MRWVQDEAVLQRPGHHNIFQVITFQEKIGKLEQDKEHWMLEAQLLQMKYEKEQQVS